MAYICAIEIDIVTSRGGPVEVRRFVLAREETRAEARADFVEVAGTVYGHFIAENWALFDQLGYYRYPGIRFVVGEQEGGTRSREDDSAA